MESKSYSFRELLSGCKNSNDYMHEFVLYFKLCAVGTLFRKGRKITVKKCQNMPQNEKSKCAKCFTM